MLGFNNTAYFGPCCVGFKNKSSTFPPVDFFPYNLAGTTFVVFITRQSFSVRMFVISKKFLCCIVLSFLFKIISFEELLFSAGTCAISSCGIS